MEAGTDAVKVVEDVPISVPSTYVYRYTVAVPLVALGIWAYHDAGSV